MLKKLLFLLALNLCLLSVFAQKATIKGVVVDTIEKKKLQYSAISLIRKSDSILVTSVRADVNGVFELPNLKKGDYSLIIAYPKMADFVRDIRLTDSSKFNLGNIHMESKSTLLNEVIIQAQKQAIQMKGDTIVYQADSFAVKPNANVQDLLRRLPGIEVDKNGAIKAAGESVKTVLVEGEEFFGDDPLLATKYLKAASVKEVQVYDRKSKQTELTGIEDGEKDKIINIKLKDNAKNGYLSTLDANSDLDHYKNIGGMAAIYKGRLKAAVYANSTNLNQDSKVTSAMSNLKGGDYDVIEVMDDGSTIAYSTGGDGDDYFSPVNGLPNFTTYGAHFSNKWPISKVGVKLNYKNAQTDVLDNRTYRGQSLLPNGTNFFNSGNSRDDTRNNNQSLKGNVEITLDSLSVMKISFAGRKYSNERQTTSYSQSLNDLGQFVSFNNQLVTDEGDGDVFNGNINYTRKSKKKGRTLTIDLQPEKNSNANTENSFNSTALFNTNGTPKKTDTLDVFNDNSGSQQSFGARVSYSEPLGKKFSLQTAYSLKTVGSVSNKMAYDNLRNRQRIDSLSNNFEFDNLSNIGKVVLQYRGKKYTLSGGVEATQTQFELNDLDRNNRFKRSYLNWAPKIDFNYKIAKGTSFSVSYNGATNQPRLDQLQPIRQISTPLFQIIGNPNLTPSFNNNVNFNFNSYQFNTEQFIYGYASYSFVRNSIASTQTIDANNKTVSSYTNLNGDKSLYASVSYQKGFTKLHFRVGLGIDYNRSRNVSILNSKLNKALNSTLSFRPTLSYDIENINLSYSPGISFLNSSSSVGTINNGKSYTHNHEINGAIQLPYKTSFGTTVSLSFRPPNASFSEALNVYIWNAYIAKRMLKSENLELKLSVSDILNEKIGYDRSVGGNTIYENTFSYIPRFILIGLTYNISGNFVKASK